MKKEKQENNDCVFLPDSELLDFAKEFSDNYKRLTVGNYFSSKKTYHIKYLTKVVDNITGKQLTTGARISNDTGIIQFDKSLFKSKEYTSDFIFYIIIWCVSCVNQSNKGDVKSADKNAIKYYLKTGRSKKNIAMGYVKLFSSVSTDLNKERIELIFQMLEINNTETN